MLSLPHLASPCLTLPYLASPCLTLPHLASPFAILTYISLDFLFEEQTYRSRSTNNSDDELACGRTSYLLRRLAAASRCTNCGGTASSFDAGPSRARRRSLIQYAFARYRTACPITNISILVRRKQSSAWCGAHHRLVFIERGIQQHGHVGDAAEAFDQAVIERICTLGHCLQATGTVHMGDRGDERSFFGADLEHLHHEGDIAVLFEPFGDIGVRHARRDVMDVAHRGRSVSHLGRLWAGVARTHGLKLITMS